MSDSDSPKRILITGASGFIGGRLSQALLDEGFSILCQYRRPIPPRNLRDLHARGAQLVRIDLSEPHILLSEATDESSANLMERLSDIDLVYHIAARTSDWGSKASFERDNVQATVAMLDAAEQAGIKYFVYVSSLSVHGFGCHRNSTEEGPYYPPTHYYQESKRRAEQIALSRHSEAFQVAVIRPGNVYGPDDTTMMFPLFQAIEKGRMGTINGGKALTPPVYIDDMVDALMAVCGTEKAYGEIINVTGGERITWREFLDMAAQFLGAPKPRVNLPSCIALPLACMLNGFWRLVKAKQPPPLTPYRIRHVMHDFHFDISKARKLLDYQPLVDCQTGLKRAAQSYKFIQDE